MNRNDYDHDPLGAATGCLYGILISIVLWIVMFLAARGVWQIIWG